LNAFLQISLRISTVDISALKLGEAIHVKDIVFPAGVKPLNDPAAIVLHVAAPMKEEAPAESG